MCTVVLGSARTGLIFTKIQAGTSPAADPTWPNRAGYSILCAIMLGSGGGELGRGNSLAAGERRCRSGPVWESGFLCCAVCVVFSPDLYHSCYCFPLFAVVLNCPYPDPPVSACFFPFSSAPRWGEGRPRGAFVAGHSQTITTGKD